MKIFFGQRLMADMLHCVLILTHFYEGICPPSCQDCLPLFGVNVSNGTELSILIGCNAVRSLSESLRNAAVESFHVQKFDMEELMNEKKNTPLTRSFHELKLHSFLIFTNRKRLEANAEEWATLVASIEELLTWIEEKDLELSTKHPVGQDHTSVKGQLDDHKVINMTVPSPTTTITPLKKKKKNCP